ncbi:MAG: hypothetical protein JWL70_3232, partial [Acidimicrobiia bacterium]|nr:hypothetical protein [Acidimicrobiia bacterium]
MKHTLGATEAESGRTPSSSTAEREVEDPIDLSNLASMAAVEVGFGGEVLRWNTGAEDLLGIAGDEAVGDSASSVIGEVLLAPALLERVLAGLRGEAWSGPE